MSCFCRSLIFVLSLNFIYFRSSLSVSMWVCTHTTVGGWSQNKLWESVLHFHYVGPEYKTQIVRFNSQHPHSSSHALCCTTTTLTRNVTCHSLQSFSSFYFSVPTWQRCLETLELGNSLLAFYLNDLLGGHCLETNPGHFKCYNFQVKLHKVFLKLH